MASEILEGIKEWLWPWQVQWLEDQSDWKVSLKSRQIGWTEVCGLEALLHAIRHGNHYCFLVSTKVANARRQILDRIKKKWLPALKRDPNFAALLEGTEVYKNSIILPNGSEIIATSMEPERLRGNTNSSYWFDEFAFWPTRVHEGLVDAVWPQVEAPQNINSVVRIVSTPWSMGENLYYQIWEDPKGIHAHFSRHEWSIKDAIKANPEGFQFDLEAARAKYPADKWAREYLCQFIEMAQFYFRRSELLEQDIDRDDLPDDLEDAPVYMGVDLGKVNDYSAVVLVRDLGDRLIVERTYAMRSIKYNAQQDIIRALIRKYDPDECYIDVTAHQSFADTLGGGVRGAMGNRKRKSKITMKLRQLVEQDKIRLNFDDAQVWDSQAGAFTRSQSRMLLDDLAKVQQTETPSGKQRFEVDRDEDGHGDTYSALLLALAARKGTTSNVSVA